jgi:outer membrane protein TolC
MKNVVFLLLLVFTLLNAQSQNSVDLYWCYDMAKQNSPILKNKELYENASNLNISNLKKAHYPQIHFNAQATYQSDVTKVEIPFDKFFEEFLAQFPNAGNLEIPEMDMPEPKKDQYKINVDLNQILYDGGITNAQKKIESARLETDLAQLEVELYQLKEKINKAFFGIMLLKESRKLLLSHSEQIERKISILEIAVKNETATQSTINQLISENVKIKQQIVETEYNSKALYKVLSILIGSEIGFDTELKISNTENIQIDAEYSRPELVMLDKTIARLDANYALVRRKNFPKLFAFAQAGYGRPAFNIFSETFDPFWIGGLKLSWNIWNWNQTKNEQKVIGIQKNIIENQKENILASLKTAYESENTNIEKINKLIEFDQEMIRLKKEIAQNASLKLDNGIITANEYIDDLNAETQARIMLESHKIQLIQSKINCKTILGN